jgi:hypothetical protein
MEPPCATRSTCFSRLRIRTAHGLPALKHSWAQQVHCQHHIAFPVHPVETLAEDFSYLAKLVAAGTLETPIVWRGDRGQLPEAIELLASRRISGKAVLRVG